MALAQALLVRRETVSTRVPEQAERARTVGAAIDIGYTGARPALRMRRKVPKVRRRVK